MRRLLVLLVVLGVTGTARAQGPPPEEEPAVGPQIPLVAGLSRVEAERRLRQAGVTRWRIEELPSQGAPDRVVAQRPPAGQALEPGTRVVLYITVPAPSPAPLAGSAPGGTAGSTPRRFPGWARWLLFGIAQIPILGGGWLALRHLEGSLPAGDLDLDVRVVADAGRGDEEGMAMR